MALLLAALISSAASAFGACPAPQGTPARLASLDERLEALLEDGTRLKFWGLDVPHVAGVAPADGRAKLLGWLAQGEILVFPLAATPDRWGRIEAHAYGPRAGREPLLVSEALVDAGLARVLPEAGNPGCLRYLLGLEAQARVQNLGLWADPRFRVLAAEDRAGFVGRSGEQVIVQGRVQSVNDAGFALFLNFGPIRTLDFAVTVRRALVKEVQAVVGPIEALEGRMVEVRGLLDTRFGPQVEVDTINSLRLLDEGVTGSPYSGRETRR